MRTLNDICLTGASPKEQRILDLLVKRLSRAINSLSVVDKHALVRYQVMKRELQDVLPPGHYLLEGRDLQDVLHVAHLHKLVTGDLVIDGRLEESASVFLHPKFFPSVSLYLVVTAERMFKLGL